MPKPNFIRRGALAALAGLGLAASVAAPAAASDCQIARFNPQGAGGLIVALVGPRAESGSWRLTGVQRTPGNGQDLNLSGQFGPSSRWTELTRSHLGSAYVTRGRNGLAELRDGEPGVDSSIDLRLTVFDRRGRVICRDRLRQEPRVSVRNQARDFRHGPGGRRF